MKLRNTFVLLALVAMMATATNAIAATIVLVNKDGIGEGFNDTTPVAPVGGNLGTTLGQQRLNVFQYAAELAAQCLVSNVPITIDVSMDPLFCNASSATLAS